MSRTASLYFLCLLITFIAPNLLLAVDGAAHQAEQLTWAVETVAGANGMSHFTDIAVDSSGRRHIVYLIRAETGSSVQYAVNDGSGWSVEPVVEIPYYADFRPLSIAVDSAGTPHIGYLLWNYPTHAVRQVTDWDSQTVVETYSLAMALTIDSADVVHVTYATTSQLHYATQDDSSWQTELITPVSYGTEFVDIATDSADQPHVVYGNSVYGVVGYGHRDTGWHVENLDYDPGVGPYAKIALDASDTPHLSYMRGTDSSSADLRYATPGLAGWHIEEIGQPPFAYADVAIDTHNRPRIACIQATDLDSATLYVATLIDDDWSMEMVDAVGAISTPSGNAYGSVGVVVDSTGMTHISYPFAEPYGEYTEIRYAVESAAYDFTVTPSSASGSGVAASTVTHEFVITNSGIFSDSYEISVDGNAWETVAHPSIAEEISPDSTAMMSVHVVIPADAVSGQTDSATISIVSQGDDTINATVAVMTTVEPADQVYVYLPLIRR